MAALGEFAIIERYFARRAADPDVVLGIGDDAAIVTAREPIAVAVDTLVGGVHFPQGFAPEDIGYRALAVNLSDMAAMGAVPRWCTLALTLPEGDAAWLEAFAAGLFELAAEFGVALIGGDLTRGPLTVSVQIIGTLPGGRALRRAGGKPGDDVYVTGSLGDAAAGLALWRAQNETGANDAGAAGEALRARFRRPVPRVAAGRALSTLAHAAIDVSDGLIADLTHLCAASGCGAEIEVERLPLSAELRAASTLDAAYESALAGGDDYELCFTAEAGARAAVEAATAGCATPVSRIGRLVSGSGVRATRAGRPVELGASGYVHF